MAKRRHRPLTDSLSVERREWYASLQRPVVAEVEYYEDIHRRERINETKERRREGKIRLLSVTNESSVVAAAGEDVKQLLAIESAESSDTASLAREFGKSTNQLQLLPVRSSSIDFTAATNGHYCTAGFVAAVAAEQNERLLAAKKGTLAIINKPCSFDPNKWIAIMNSPKYVRAFVVCFPPIGCSHIYYNRWAAPLAEQNIKLVGVCLPARLNRVQERNFKSINGIATAVVKSLVAAGVSCKLTKRETSHVMPLSRGTTVHTAFSGSRLSTFAGGTAYMSAASPSSPHKHSQLLRNAVTTAEEEEKDEEEEQQQSPNVIFFGHDIGSIIAYETARLLNACKYRVTAMIVSGACSPYLLSKNNADPFTKKHCFLPGKELMQHMSHELDLVPKLFKERFDLLRKFIPLFRGDYYLMEKYRIQPPYIGKEVVEGKLIVRDPTLASDYEESESWDINSRKSAEVASRINTARSAISGLTHNGARRNGHAAEDDFTANDHAEVAGIDHDNDYDNDAVEDTIGMPATLFKLRIPIISVRSEEDSSISREEVDAWESLSNAYEAVVLEFGSHGRCLNLPENYETIMDLLTRFADYESSSLV